MFYHIAQDIK